MKVYSYDEAAVILKVCPNTIVNWVKRGVMQPTPRENPATHVMINGIGHSELSEMLRIQRKMKPEKFAGVGLGTPVQ